LTPAFSVGKRQRGNARSRRLTGGRAGGGADLAGGPACAPAPTGQAAPPLAPGWRRGLGRLSALGREGYDAQSVQCATALWRGTLSRSRDPERSGADQGRVAFARCCDRNLLNTVDYILKLSSTLTRSKISCRRVSGGKSGGRGPCSLGKTGGRWRTSHGDVEAVVVVSWRSPSGWCMRLRRGPLPTSISVALAVRPPGGGVAKLPSLATALSPSLRRGRGSPAAVVHSHRRRLRRVLVATAAESHHGELVALTGGACVLPMAAAAAGSGGTPPPAPAPAPAPVPRPPLAGRLGRRVVRVLM